MTTRTGGCACGHIRFTVGEPFMGIGACHCTDCQKSTGGGPNYVALAAPAGLTVTKGEAKLYRSTGDSGGEVSRAFCPECGTPLWSTPAGAPFLPVKLGALDNHADLKPAIHIYTSSAAPWHLMGEGLPTFPKMPPGPPPGA